MQRLVKEAQIVSNTRAVTGERADLLASLDRHRDFLRYTTRGLTDEQAAQRTTVSELCLGGLIKHVTATERQWTRFIVEGPSAMAFDPATIADTWMDLFKMTAGDTLAGLLERYEQIAAETDDLVRRLPDLGEAQRLPEAPWFEAGASW